MIELDKSKRVTESERAACEQAIAEKLGPDAPQPRYGAAGNSPYSPETICFLACGADTRGARVALAPVCRSHDGAGHYKGRGRWRTVCICAPKADGAFAVCDAGDRDSEEVGYSGFYVRPWSTHEAEEASKGLGLGADAMYAALEAVGL